MPEDKVEELPAADTPAEAKPASPIIPLIAILVLLPVLSFLMTEFVLIPRMKQAVAEQTGAHGDDAHAEVKVAKAEKGSDGYGEGYGDEAAYGSASSYEFSNIVANLAGSLKSRYVKVSFTVEGEDPAFASKIETNRAKLIDTTLGILASLTLSDLENPGMKNQLRSDLIAAYETALQERVITQLYFSEFVVQ